jgi:GDP-L-fucose synthase
MHVDDAAQAILLAIEFYDSPQIINIGWGEDISVSELTVLIAREAGFEGDLIWDNSKPEGMPRKCMDVSRMRCLGYEPKITLGEGIRRTIQEYRLLKVSV